MSQFEEANDLEIIFDDPSTIIDNGKDRIEIDFNKIRMELMNIVDKEIINKAISIIMEFKIEVNNELKKGMHCGSTELNDAILSLFWEIKPEDIGLETEIEVRLLGLAFKDACSKKEQEDELEILE